MLNHSYPVSRLDDTSVMYQGAAADDMQRNLHDGRRSISNSRSCYSCVVKC